MALSKKDQRIVTITLCLVMGFVVWSFGIEPVWNQYTELSEDLAKEQKRFEDNQELLNEATSIDEGYKAIEAQFPQDDPDNERDASDVFNEEVVDLVEEQTGVSPNYRVPTTVDINAPGYQFLILPLSLKTNLEKTAKLLNEFDKRGYLIQTLKITRDSNLDSEELSLEMNLGRIVKIEEPTETAGPARPGSLRLGARGRR